MQGGVDKSVPVVDGEEALERWRAHCATQPQLDDVYAFYSSHLGAITKNVQLMFAPLDDHIVHRGHAVFDTAMVWNSQMYQLDQHLARLLRSAALVQVGAEESGWDDARLKNIVLCVARAAGREKQFLRFWLSVGRGGFGVSARECQHGVAFYCVSLRFDRKDTPSGISTVTSKVPMKLGLFATAKTTNYLPNALVAMEAERTGGYQSVWVDENGNVAEMATANLVFVLDDVLTAPSFERSLAGITLQRVLHIASKHLGMKVEQRRVSLREAKASSEVAVLVAPYVLSVVKWDEESVGDGKPGPVAVTLSKALHRDMCDAWGEDGHLETL